MAHPEAPKYWENGMGYQHRPRDRAAALARDGRAEAATYQTPGPKGRPGATDPNFRVKDFPRRRGFDRNLLMPGRAGATHRCRRHDARQRDEQAYNNYLHDFAPPADAPVRHRHPERRRSAACVKGDAPLRQELASPGGLPQ